EGLDNEEIAQIMGIERQSAANTLHRALYQLKNQIPMLVRIMLLPFFTSFA
ncbi:sigma factor-like helix-turn-helix DNA-binding protein, partial [Siphonobacter sp.]